MESKESTFECLDGKINNMARGFATMQKRFKKLERVNNALTHFNKSFGSFLYGLSVNDSSIQWPGVIISTLSRIQMIPLTKAILSLILGTNT